MLLLTYFIILGHASYKRTVLTNCKNIISIFEISKYYLLIMMSDLVIPAFMIHIESWI